MLFSFIHSPGNSVESACNVIVDIIGIFFEQSSFFFCKPNSLIELNAYFCCFLQDFTDLTASSASFIPTVTAISTSPDLQWMVQPLVSSVAPSRRAHPYTSTPCPAYPRSAMKSAASKAHNSTKRGRMEQVISV